MHVFRMQSYRVLWNRPRVDHVSELGHVSRNSIPHAILTGDVALQLELAPLEYVIFKFIFKRLIKFLREKH